MMVLGAAPDVLQRIVADTREQLGVRRVRAAEIEAQAREVAAATNAHRFAQALQASDRHAVKIIAEIKAASPSAGVIVEKPDVEGIAAAYGDGGAAAISVVTEENHFRGSRDWLRRAATAGLPVIMKDFVVEELQIFEGVAAGADAMLLLASILEAGRIRDFIGLLHELGRDALVEVHDEEELERAVAAGARLIGVNNRNLRDFSVSLSTAERLSKGIPAGVIRVAESGIRDRHDVDRLLRAGFHAFLVGESLLRHSDRRRAVEQLLEVSGEAPGEGSQA